MNTTTTIEKMIDSIAAVCIDLGLRGGYTPEEITDLVCDIAFAHMYDALRDRAETVYAYSTDGDRSMTLKYRSRKLFDREAMGGNGVRAVGGSTSMNKRNSVK